MKFKLIIALTTPDRTDKLVKASRESGATGCTILGNARGAGLRPKKTFLGLDLAGQRDMLLILTEEHLSRNILEHLAEVGHFDEEPGSGIAFSLDIEDAVGLTAQIATLSTEIEDEL